MTEELDKLNIKSDKLNKKSDKLNIKSGKLIEKLDKLNKGPAPPIGPTFFIPYRIYRYYYVSRFSAFNYVFFNYYIKFK